MAADSLEVVPGDAPRDPWRARVLLLCGPSGAGKTRLAERLHARHGWPVVRLDDFYRDGDDPGLPRQPALGIPDWDDPRSWDAPGAIRALEELVATGSAAMPVYDIATSRRVGTRGLTCAPSDVIVAEGVFAAELVAALRERGLLHGAWCVRARPLTTMARRLIRDLRERRKPPLVLLRRGWALMRAEPQLVARAAAHGARPTTATELAAAMDREVRESRASGTSGIR